VTHLSFHLGGATLRPKLEKSVARYLAQLDTADLQEPSAELVAKTAHLKEKRLSWKARCSGWWRS
jgi:hypothetical protein